VERIIGAFNQVVYDKDIVKGNDFIDIDILPILPKLKDGTKDGASKLTDFLERTIKGNLHNPPFRYEKMKGPPEGSIGGGYEISDDGTIKVVIELSAGEDYKFDKVTLSDGFECSSERLDISPWPDRLRLKRHPAD